MEIGTFKNVHLMAEQLESYLLDQQDSKLNSFVKRNSYGKSLGRQGLNLGAYFLGIKAVLSNCPGFVRSGGGGGGRIQSICPLVGISPLNYRSRSRVSRIVVLHA